MVNSMMGICCVFTVHLCVSADALFIDGVVGVSQQDIGETGLQQVHGQEGRLLHDLQHEQQHSPTVRSHYYITTVFSFHSTDNLLLSTKQHKCTIVTHDVM